MGGLQVGALIEHSTNIISAREFLANRRPTAHLFDLAPHMDPAAFQPGDEVDAEALYAMVRTEGERQSDVRLLVDNGQRHLGLANALARSLRCDVYLTPDGGQVRYVRETSPGGDLWDAIAIDVVSGEPTDWLVVRPTDLPAGVATWFVTARGRLRQSSGLVKVDLPTESRIRCLWVAFAGCAVLMSGTAVYFHSAAETPCHDGEAAGRDAPKWKRRV